jgi:hypothetical protein
MTKKQRKRKQKEPDNERYEFEVENWEMEYQFELNMTPKDLVPGLFWEHATCILICKLNSPVLKYGNKARIEVVGKPELDNHWAQDANVKSAIGIGSIEILRGDDIIRVYCMVPSRSFPYIPVAASSGKIKFVSIDGTKLKYRKGDIFGITLRTNWDEDDESDEKTN